LPTFCLLHTEFADLTWEEFQKSKLGAAQNCSATLKGSHKLTEEALPETVSTGLSLPVPQLLENMFSCRLFLFDSES